jgi:hypothetical protein
MLVARPEVGENGSAVATPLIDPRVAVPLQCLFLCRPSFTVCAASGAANREPGQREPPDYWGLFARFLGETLQLLVFAGLVFLFPVAAYCLFLAMINNRPQPTLVSGPWDFAGVLFATSGFWLVGGPTALSAFHNRSRLALAQGHVPSPAGLLASGWEFWLIIWGAYFTIILGGAILLLLRRRAVTVIYNIASPTLDDALVRSLAQLRLQATRLGNRLFLSPASEPLADSSSDAIQPAPRYPGASLVPVPAGTIAENRPEPMLGQATLEIDPFPAMRNISLRWRPGNQTLRRDVEAELARELAKCASEDNPAAGWFLTLASCLFGALFLGLVGFIIFLSRTR